VARFIAIPVTVGDAFYLERGGRSILVDGGKSERAFPELFRQHVRRDGADIVVCTHNDADHANGIIGFLEAGLACREVWLPGSWLGTVKDLMRPDGVVINEIIDGAIEFWERNCMRGGESPSTIEQAGAMIPDRGFESKRLDGDTPSDWPEDVTDAIEEAEDSLLPEQWDWWWRKYVRHYRYFPLFSSEFWDIVEGAIEAGKRIKRIARLAYANGVPVRWFQYDPGSADGGILGFLHVLSARPVVRVFPSGTLFVRLALTTVNKESLVLYSPRDYQSPGVLFCADSDLQGIPLPLLPRDLITVPHHGAEANQGVYIAVKSALGKSLNTVTWVRSDARVKKRPCSAYCELPGRRFCTVCRIGPPKQRVALFGRGGFWARQSKVRRCEC
jgi:hypothetical protein